MPQENLTLKITNESIGEQARAFLTKFQPEVLKRPMRTDLASLLRQVKISYSYDFIVSDLGLDRDSKVLGITDFKNKVIGLDESFVQNDYNKTVRVPFVLAHELGHCIIHGPRYNALKMAGVFEEQTTDTLDAVTGRKTLVTERDFVEHHANVFAGCILMPSETVQQALITAQKNLGINRGVGKVYVDHHEYSIRDFNDTIVHLRRVYSVSKETVRTRLNQLGLITGPDLKKMRLDHIMMEIFGNQEQWI